MIKEYSNEVRGKVHAYRFEPWEKKTIADSLKPIIKKIEKKIDKIHKHPKNEGQATFYEAKRELLYEIKAIKEIIEEFTK
jgi:hypothetical protein